MDDTLTTRELTAQGLASHEIRSMVREGALVRLRRGVYRRAEKGPDPVPVAERPRRDHLERIAAMAPVISRLSVFSHASAAAVHEIPVRHAAFAEVQVTRPDRRSGRLRAGLRVRSASLPPEHVVELDGRRVTTAARTACDLARSEPLEWGVGALDDVLHRGLATMDELREVARQQLKWVGHRPLARALELADGRSESIGESLSRVLLHQAGLAPDVLQQGIRVDGVVYRVDFYWNCRVVGEFDGRAKYGESGDAVWREKRREDALRRAGFIVVRWTWDEVLHHPEVVVQRVRRALEQARSRAA